MREKFFSDIDGLILATIWSNPKHDVVSWIAFIDAYYRILISYDELNNSLNKLQKYGLITFKNNCFICTDKTEKLLSRKGNIGTTTWIFEVQERIVKLSFCEIYNIAYHLLKTEYESALKQYRALFKN